jgi:hypothetical protein
LEILNHPDVAVLQIAGHRQVKAIRRRYPPGGDASQLLPYNVRVTLQIHMQ